MRSISLRDFLELHVVCGLSPRARRVIGWRMRDVYEIGENAMTLQHIGRVEGITHEAVRQIVARAKCKIDTKLYLLVKEYRT